MIKIKKEMKRKRQKKCKFSNNLGTRWIGEKKKSLINKKREIHVEHDPVIESIGVIHL